MPELVKDLVNSVITEISQVPGVATQIYAADRIKEFIQNAYRMEINEMWWPQYMYYQLVGIDGVTGALTSDLKGPLSFIDDYGDIAAVYRNGSNRKLRELNQSINPDLMTTGLDTWYLAPDYSVPHRPFRVYPITSTGPVKVWARQQNTLPFALTDSVFLDGLLLKYDACWMYAIDDGTVPAQVSKYQMLATKRRQQLKANLAQQPLELDPRFPSGAIVYDEPSQDWFTLNQSPLA
jgi:hypothetical protein